VHLVGIYIVEDLIIFLDMTPRRFRRSLHRRDSPREALFLQGTPRRVFTFLWLTQRWSY